LAELSLPQPLATSARAQPDAISVLNIRPPSRADKRAQLPQPRARAAQAINTRRLA
jgi:hypothetical protein